MRAGRRIFVPLLTAGLGAIILLAGCAGGDSTTQGEIAPAQNPVTSEPGAEIIRNADMSLRVTDVRETVDRIDSITAQAGGRIASESVTSTGDSLYASVTARVPTDRLDSVITAVGDLGEVMSLSVVAEDVTAQGADLDARIEALQVSITRLRQLLASAETTKDLIEIEAELTARQAELDSLVAQRAALSDLVALSTLNVTVDPRSEAAVWTPPGFVSGLESGWNALRTVTSGLVTLLGFLLPFLGVLAILAVPIVLLIFLLRRRK
jgi:hypothetical protein